MEFALSRPRRHVASVRRTLFAWTAQAAWSFGTFLGAYVFGGYREVQARRLAYWVFAGIVGPKHPPVEPAAAAQLYDGVREGGLEVLYDDRQESAGVKFNDADLLGLPVRAVVSPRNLRTGVVEIKARSSDEAVVVPLDDAVERIRELLSA